MRRPSIFTRNSSTGPGRYNPIYDDTAAKKAEKSHSRSSPTSFFSFSSATQSPPRIPNPHPTQCSDPPPRTGMRMSDEEDIFGDGVGEERMEDIFASVEDADADGDKGRSSASSSRLRTNSSSNSNRNYNEKPNSKTANKRKEKREKERAQKEREKERQREKKRKSGLGWAKSWSFGGEKFGGTVLADASGVRVPIFRLKLPLCGWGCGE